MSDLDLRLRNGSVVAVDPETGDTIPLSLGDTEHESVETDEIDIGQLIAALNAAGNDITDVGEFTSDSVETDEINDGGPLSDGDGTERQIWVIANGASDPSGADSEDIIFEEE